MARDNGIVRPFLCCGGRSRKFYYCDVVVVFVARHEESRPPEGRPSQKLRFGSAEAHDDAQERTKVGESESARDSYYILFSSLGLVCAGSGAECSRRTRAWERVSSNVTEWQTGRTQIKIWRLKIDFCPYSRTLLS